MALKAGNYIVRIARPSGWQQTTPANNAGYHLSVGSGGSVTGLIFGERRGS